MIVVATAGWSVPRFRAGDFPGEGTHLQRYARVLPGVEINSSFYRPHAGKTYERWAAQTPQDFRFAAKLPRSITHDAKLRGARLPIEIFLAELAGLGTKLGPLLVQLPPSLLFESRVANVFFSLLRERHEGFIVCEPRHPTWFEAGPDALLKRYRIGRVAADPAISPAAAIPGGWPGIVYYRLHGSPRKYWSLYTGERIADWTRKLNALPHRTTAWCVFDNTASGGAITNALEMQQSVIPASAPEKRRSGRKNPASTRG